MPHEYIFNKQVRLYDALNAQLKSTFGANSAGLSSADGLSITVYMNSPLSGEDEARLGQLVAKYVDPPYWLELDRTENHALRSLPTNASNCSVFLETFIMSPYIDNQLVMGSMKTIVRCSTQDAAWVTAWDPNTQPVRVEVRLHCGSTGRDITSNAIDVTAELDAAWRGPVSAGSNALDLPAVYKSVQLFGLKDACPSSDRIWHLQGAISNSNVSIDLHGLQKLFYQVVLPV